MHPSESPLPIIRIMLGNDFETIQRQSTYRFPRTDLGKIDIIAADQPFIFEYARAGCGFTLPPARSFGAAMNNAHAVSITVSPQLRFASLDEALEIARKTEAILESSNWKVSRKYVPIKQIKDHFSNPQIDTNLTVRIEDMVCGEDYASLDIERQWRKNDSLPRLSGRDTDLLVVSLKLNNDDVRHKFNGR